MRAKRSIYSQDSSLFSPFLAAVLGGTADWGDWAGISSHRESLEKAVIPRVGFQEAANSFGLYLVGTLKTATESLCLISKTARRIFVPYPQ